MPFDPYTDWRQHIIEVARVNHASNALAAIAEARGKLCARKLYLIRRHGAWFREAGHGYTLTIANAGVFSAAEAASYLNVEGVGVVPIDALRNLAVVELAKSEAHVAGLKTLLAQIDAGEGL